MSEEIPEGLVDHAVIDKIFVRLLEAVKRGDVGEGATILAQLTAKMDTHLAHEEPNIELFAKEDEAEAKALIEQHAGFRASLAELAAKGRAGTLAAAEVQALRMRVSLHESREETGFYRWFKAR